MAPKAPLGSECARRSGLRKRVARTRTRLQTDTRGLPGKHEVKPGNMGKSSTANQHRKGEGKRQGCAPGGRDDEGGCRGGRGPGGKNTAELADEEAALRRRTLSLLSPPSHTTKVKS